MGTYIQIYDILNENTKNFIKVLYWPLKSSDNDIDQNLYFYDDENKNIYQRRQALNY